MNEFALINEMKPLQKSLLQEHCTFATKFSLKAPTIDQEGDAQSSKFPKLLMILPLSVVGSLETQLFDAPKRKHPIDKATLLRLLGDVAIGLGHMHAMQLLHRDVGARNVLLNLENAPDSSPRLRARLCDFGLSALVHANFHQVVSLTWAPETIAKKQVPTPTRSQLKSHSFSVLIVLMLSLMLSL